jgi:hypothetical protein
MENLEDYLYQRLIMAEEESKKVLKYASFPFIEMLHSYGAIGTARRILSSPMTTAYGSLWEKGRLDLTLEALIIEDPKVHALFTDEELNTARHRLKECGYKSK